MRDFPISWQNTLMNRSKGTLLSAAGLGLLLSANVQAREQGLSFEMDRLEYVSLENPDGGENLSPAMMTGSPISAPANTWTWVDFPDSKCADGSATGIGVNINPNSDRLVIFFEGGGSCWDYDSCWVQSMSVNLDGYTGADFTKDKPYSSIPLFDRANANNPLSDASYVYVPYCTGDVHSGTKMTPLASKTATKDTYFWGYNNVSAYLQRLVPTFDFADRVWVSGWSAGGFGAAFNWGHIQDAFGTTRVDTLDDSGQPINPNKGKWQTWQATWGIPIPAGCTNCSTDLTYIIDYYASRFEGTNRFGLLSYTNDSVISTYMSMTTREFRDRLMAMTKDKMDGLTSLRYFYVNGVSHVLMSQFNQAGADGTRLSTWIRQMVEDDPSWTSIRP